MGFSPIVVEKSPRVFSPGVRPQSNLAALVRGDVLAELLGQVHDRVSQDVRLALQLG
jgi:hypothetical protein